MSGSGESFLRSAGAGLGSLSRRTIRDEIAGKIAALISSRLLQVGDELPGERELAAALSVSRETVRGAIRVLAERGVLEVTHGARTRIATLETGDLALASPGRLSVSSYALDEVHSARLILEGEAVQLAARRIDGGTLAVLARLIAAQESMLDDPLRFMICDREFHTTVYRAGGNSLVADLALDLYGYMARTRRDIVAKPGQIAESIAEHRAILEGLRARDPVAAVEAFAAHERRIYATTRALLEERRAPRPAAVSGRGAKAGGPGAQAGRTSEHMEAGLQPGGRRPEGERE